MNTPNTFATRRSLLLSSLAALAQSGAWSQAPAWPTRPVTIVVPFAPGGAGNGSVRILADVIGPQLGQPLVIDNRPGAGGITGTASVVATGDDHTLLMGSTTMTILPALRRDLPYDTQRDLQPLGMVSSQPQMLVVPVNSPLKTLDDLVRLGRAGGLSAGNAGVGTLSHLATELVNHRLGTKITPVPYKGDTVLLPDVVSGTISIGVVNLPVGLPLVQSGKLRALAVTAAEPVPALPGVPVLKTLGADFVVTGWAALFAGPKVPAAGAARFEQALLKALADPGVQERFAALGVKPESSSATGLRDFVRSETVRWGDVVRSGNIKLE